MNAFINIELDFLQIALLRRETRGITVLLTIKVFLFGFNEGSIKNKDELRAREFVKEGEKEKRGQKETELLGPIKDSSTDNDYKGGPSIAAEANTPRVDSA